MRPHHYRNNHKRGENIGSRLHTAGLEVQCQLLLLRQVVSFARYCVVMATKRQVLWCTPGCCPVRGCFLDSSLGSAQRAQQARALATLPGDLGSVPSL